MPQDKKKYGIADLLQIMDRLRSPDGCPWDREQVTGASART
jgi:tetrapyrrole methylase family protein/MazG family protein